MLWGLQSCPTTVLSERMWHFRGSRHAMFPPSPTYFLGVRTTSTPMIYAPGMPVDSEMYYSIRLVSQLTKIIIQPYIWGNIQRCCPIRLSVPLSVRTVCAHKSRMSNLRNFTVCAGYIAHRTCNSDIPIFGHIGKSHTGRLKFPIGANSAALSYLHIWCWNQWSNTHWTRLDKCQGPLGSRGPQAWPYFFYILIFQVSGVSHLFYSTADFFVNVLRPSSSYNVWSSWVVSIWCSVIMKLLVQ